MDIVEALELATKVVQRGSVTVIRPEEALMMTRLLSEAAGRVHSRQLNRYSLLLLCEEAHMACTGAADGASTGALCGWRDILQGRLDVWMPNSGPFGQYDASVKTLVEATLAELKKEIQGRRDADFDENFNTPAVAR